MANFVENFKNKENNKEFLSEKILNQLNEEFNGDLKYEFMKNSYILLPNKDTKSITMRLENFDIENIEVIKKNCGKDSITIEQLFEYSYNAQETIYLKPKENFKQIINDHEIKNWVISRYKNHILKDGVFSFTPEKMDQKIKINIGAGKGEESYPYIFIRKPFAHLTKKKYETSDTSNLFIQLIIDDNYIHVDIELNYKNIKNATEYLKLLYFLNTIVDKGVFINGQKVADDFIRDEIYNQRCNLILTWKKIVQIEQEVGKEFKLISDDIDEEQLELIYLLHQTLVEKKPVKYNEKVNNFSYKKNDEVLKKLESAKDNRNLYLEKSDKKEFMILGNKLSLYEIRGYFNLYIRKLEDKKEKIIVHIEEKNDYKIYSGVLLFITEGDLIDFQKKKDHAIILHNAEELKPDFI